MFRFLCCGTMLGLCCMDAVLIWAIVEASDQINKKGDETKLVAFGMILLSAFLFPVFAMMALYFLFGSN